MKRDWSTMTTWRHIMTRNPQEDYDNIMAELDPDAYGAAFQVVFLDRPAPDDLAQMMY